MTRAPYDPNDWTGRVDGQGPEHLKWHQAVGSSAIPSIAIIGFCSDEGVRRNQGRVGAAGAPAHLRRALAPLAYRLPAGVVDLGDVTVNGTALEAGQAELAGLVREQVDAGRLPVVLGGGHEVAYGTFSGIATSAKAPLARRIGILNLDAHFDLREAPEASSGTPFRQIARDEAVAGREFAYFVVGISEPSNTPVLFDMAEELGTRWILDESCRASDLSAVTRRVEEFIAGVDLLYLTIDLDVLPAATAPGVSAPAGFGVELEVIRSVALTAARSGILTAIDIAELNPAFDIDARTARTAARLVNDILTAASVCERKSSE